MEVEEGCFECGVEGIVDRSRRKERPRGRLIARWLCEIRTRKIESASSGQVLPFPVKKSEKTNLGELR